ncbi:fucolectin [Plakobranchus ocellatus]|uniref:Fucolectin n=1 Tax=Plakobranchus ocellatus TaxID=259542 RepID=A0AAV4D585_9GAST|nr:fucolectin [Plakobranchus ocellatus]
MSQCIANLFIASSPATGTLASQSQPCDPGLFGDRCQFQCHCAANTPCDPSNGACSGGCDPQCFGPGCQYDVSQLTTYNGFWLTDSDDGTCNNNGNAESVTVVLETPHPLIWVRVVVNDSRRNVALKQATEQSSRFQDWYAKNVVDGTPSGSGINFDQRLTCSHTSGAEIGWWRVTFSNDVEINRLIIYNREDCCRNRLVNFTLQAYSSSGTNPVYSYTDPGSPALLVYTVVPRPPIQIPVESVRYDMFHNITILHNWKIYGYDFYMDPLSPLCQRSLPAYSQRLLRVILESFAKVIDNKRWCSSTEIVSPVPKGRGGANMGLAR